MTDLERPAHSLDVAEALASAGATVEGLSATEAERRFQATGPNELRAASRVSPGRILWGQVTNVLVVVLFLATAASAALGHGLEAVVISVIVVFAVLLGFVQEFRAERAIEALRRMAAPNATVLRGGAELRIPARAVVPGDVLLLKAGDQIAADARLVESMNLQVEEAPLTGESLPVEKDAARVLPADAVVGDRVNMVHGGTTVTYGRGRALVTRTGMETEFGRIARMLQSVEVGRTPLQVNLDTVGALLARAAGVVVVVVVVLGLLRGQPLVEMVVFGIALAVAVVPEALPAVVTIALALGVQRMVRRNALMRRLAAVETLGGTTVIASDKTGTLTRDEMTVRQVWVGGRRWDVGGAGYVPEGAFSVAGHVQAPDAALHRLLTAGVGVNDATLVRAEGSWEMKGDPTEGALVVLAQKAGLVKPDVDAAHPRVAEIPFSSETKRMTTLHTAGRGTVAWCKGAPEVVVGACDAWVGPNGDGPLDDDARRALAEAAGAMAADALRVLAIAERRGATVETMADGLTLLGLVGMIDPPRPEAKDAITTCRGAGIRVVMITGDHPVTASAVARELGLLGRGRVVTGVELDTLDEAGLDAAVADIDVYARVSPAHKLRVVEAFQRRGEVVAMTGDGVNDAPALKRADIGVAMGITGTDVSREAAAMTLLDDNFASIVAAVEEGRGIFENIRKFLMYLLSSNLGEIGLMAGAALLGLPIPLSAVQILYVNLATDGFPALALAIDPSDPATMRRPPRNTRQGIFDRPVVSLIGIGGVWTTLCTLGVFWGALATGRTDAHASTMTFACLVLIQFINAYNYRSDRQSVVVRPVANRWLNLAVIWEIVLLICVLTIPALRAAFGTQALSPAEWGVVLGAAATSVPVLELGKLAVRRGCFGRPS